MKKKIWLVLIVMLVISGVALAQDGDTPTYVEELAFTGVERNEAWKPYSETIDGVEMVLVPAGCFMMGSEDGDEDEKPVHQQCFDEPFWIDKYEVTNAQYGSAPDDSNCLKHSTEPDQPHNCVTWFDAHDYCEGRGARLPTEREWEYAARGPDNLIYPWGNEFIGDNVIYEDIAEYGDRKPAPVGSRPAGASWVGAMDMSGNVTEWVSTIYGEYDYDEGEFINYFSYPYDEHDGRESNNRESSSGDMYIRALRGGSFYINFDDLRAANRGWVFSHSEFDGAGFRCARSY